MERRMKYLKLLGIALMAIAAFVASAIQSIAAASKCYVPFSSDGPNSTEAFTRVQPTSRRAVFTKQLAANNSISDRQVRLA